MRREFLAFRPPVLPNLDASGRRSVFNRPPGHDIHAMVQRGQTVQFQRAINIHGAGISVQTALKQLESLLAQDHRTRSAMCLPTMSSEKSLGGTKIFFTEAILVSSTETHALNRVWQARPCVFNSLDNIHTPKKAHSALIAH